ncbi:MAG TPA: ferredoxin [archaeon]|nr:ferredoxin [archaeon]
MKGLFGLGKKKEPAPELKKFLVTYDLKGCIGAGACEAVDPKHWKVMEDRKAQLKDSKQGADGLFELEISELEVVKMKEAAEGCPKNVIHITDKSNGEKII